MDQLPCGSVLTPAIKIHSAHFEVPWPKHSNLLRHFLTRTSLCFTDQETQEENVLGGTTPCGSVLTPAMSCTKFKITSVHAESPKAQTLNSHISLQVF